MRRKFFFSYFSYFFSSFSSSFFYLFLADKIQTDLLPQYLLFELYPKIIFDFSIARSCVLYMQVIKYKSQMKDIRV